MPHLKIIRRCCYRMYVLVRPLEVRAELTCVWSRDLCAAMTWPWDTGTFTIGCPVPGSAVSNAKVSTKHSLCWHKHWNRTPVF